MGEEMAKEDKKILVRMKRNTWMYMRKKAFDQEISLNELINTCLEKYIKRCENKVDRK